MPSTQLYFELPSDIKPLADLLSANAQMYLQCVNCGWEQRANPLYGLPPTALLSEACDQCGATKPRVVRHLVTVQGHCLDCGRDLGGMTTLPWEDLRCPNCLSHRLEIVESDVTPSYPLKFGEVGDRSPFAIEEMNFMRKNESWGVDAWADANHLRLEATRAVQMHPADSYGYMMCEVLFGESLLASNAYGEDDKGFPTLVAQISSQMRDYFRQVGALGVGLRALELHEVAVAIERDPANKAAWDHNLAIMINSLLSRYPEDVITTATERPEIRQEALAYAARALRYYMDNATQPEPESGEDEQKEGESDKAEEILPRGFSYSAQAARTFHLMGDLLRTGDSTNEERRQALEAYGHALEWDLPEDLVPGLRQSRGETTLMLEDATSEELTLAWQDLEAALAADTRRLGRSTPWALLYNMAQIAERLGDGATELEMLDKSARIAMAIIRQNWEEFGLQRQSEPMAPVFDRLAYRYAEERKAADALSAAEALRAATVRVHTKTQEQRFEDLKEMFGQAGRDLARAHLRQAGETVNLADSVLESEAARIDSVKPAVDRLLAASGAVPTAVVSFSNPVWKDGSYAVVAFVCGNSGKGKPFTRSRILRPNFEGLEWDMALVRPGPFREGRLRRLHTAVGEAFLGPLLRDLDKIGVERIVFSLPAILSRYAFEALPLGGGERDVLIRRCEVAYVPSIAAATDRKEHTPQANGKLLVVGYQGDDLTYAAGEVERLQELFGDRVTLISGKDCTKVKVLEQLSAGYDYIHFVCHGTYDEAMPLNAALHLVPDVQDDSQRVTAGDIFANVKFPGSPLITMSACSTALMSNSAVNNCHGLTGSFLRAGARAVVGSRWPVYDATSALFMRSVYERIEDGGFASPLGCVAEVQRELAREHGIEDFASFSYMGMA